MAKQEKECPKCKAFGKVDDLFGWRIIAGKYRRPQSYCTNCRSKRPPAEPPKAPPAPPKLTPPKAKPKVLEKKKKCEPRNNYKERKCRECGVKRTVDCFEKTRCIFCAKPTVETKKLWEQKQSAWAAKAYKVHCDTCRRALNPTKEPWAGGMCENCWPPGSRTELMKIWEQYHQ